MLLKLAPLFATLTSVASGSSCDDVGHLSELAQRRDHERFDGTRKEKMQGRRTGGSLKRWSRQAHGFPVRRREAVSGDVGLALEVAVAVLSLPHARFRR